MRKEIDLKEETDVFDVDLLRQQLAKANRMQELYETYLGDYKEISDISTAEKWDNLSGTVTAVPEVRIKRLEKVVNLIDPNKTILDIGVGWGDIIPILRGARKGADYTGIDFSDAVVKALAGKYPEHTFRNTTVDNLTNQYDCVLVLEVMEHIVPSRIFGFLSEVHRVLSDDGTLIVTVPLNEDLRNGTFLCGKCGGFVNRMGHVRSYSISLVSAELKRAGFSVEYTEIMYDGYYGLKGTAKRFLRDLAGYIVGPSGYKPLLPVCVILKCHKSE